AFEAEAAALYAAPMETDEMRSFTKTLLDVDAAGTAPGLDLFQTIHQTAPQRVLRCRRFLPRISASLNVVSSHR
ncbi:hypothetical protein QRB38_23105, partial [Mycobacterium avium subsp. hominissuis]|uniref:hypothetical protein n=1 Tax=Mycobacterium avium TaxID=1764 RepID=UPI0026657BD0